LFWRCGEERAALLWRAAVGPGGDLLDLGNRHRPGGQQAEHNIDAMGDAALAVSPTSDAPWADAKQLGDAMLREAERAECRAKLDRSR
jgi:hypothetical protein